MANWRNNKKWFIPGCLVTSSSVILLTGSAQAGATLELQSSSNNNVVAASSNVPIYLYGVDSGPSPMTDEQIYATSSNPAINSIDLVTGTVFASNYSPGSYVTGSFDANDAGAEIDVSSGTVSDNGLLATIYVDTTGLAGQQFTLELTNVEGENTLLDDSGNAIAISGNGVGSPYTFDVASVPEPATISLVGLSSFGLLMRRRRA